MTGRHGAAAERGAPARRELEALLDDAPRRANRSASGRARAAPRAFRRGAHGRAHAARSSARRRSAVGERIHHARARGLARARARPRRRARAREACAACLVAHNLLLGDTLMLTPLLAKLRANHPACRDHAARRARRSCRSTSERPYGVRALPFKPSDSATTRALLDEKRLRPRVRGGRQPLQLARRRDARAAHRRALGRPRVDARTCSSTSHAPIAAKPDAWGDMVATLVDGATPPPYARGIGARPARVLRRFPRCPTRCCTSARARRSSAGPRRAGWRSPPELERRGHSSRVERGPRRGRRSCASAIPRAAIASYRGTARPRAAVAPHRRRARCWSRPTPASRTWDASTFTPTVTLFGPGSAVLCAPGEFWSDAPWRALTARSVPLPRPADALRAPHRVGAPLHAHDRRMRGAALHARDRDLRRAAGRGSNSRAAPVNSKGVPGSAAEYTLGHDHAKSLRFFLVARCSWHVRRPSPSNRRSMASRRSRRKRRPAPKLRLAPLAAPTTSLSPVDRQRARAHTRQARHSNTSASRSASNAQSMPAQLPAAATLHGNPCDGGCAAQARRAAPRKPARCASPSISPARPRERADGVLRLGQSVAPRRPRSRGRHRRIARNPWWSPVTDGDTQTVEFFAPRRDRCGVHCACASPASRTSSRRSRAAFARKCRTSARRARATST